MSQPKLTPLSVEEAAARTGADVRQILSQP